LQTEISIISNMLQYFVKCRLNIISKQAKYETSFLERYYVIKLLQAEFHVDRHVP